ncbi:MAG: hypothetical protein GPI95_17055 [Microcystis aeruginosa LG13-11]|nr:hypothetical protein [Microcystis aeruginosa LG13-11]
MRTGPQAETQIVRFGNRRRKTGGEDVKIAFHILNNYGGLRISLVDSPRGKAYPIRN